MDNWLIQSGNDAVRGYLNNDRQRDMSQVRHEIVHRVATPKQYYLPPIQNNQPTLPLVNQPPQHIIQQIPQPVFQSLVPENNNNNRGGMFNKGDWMEMMMMQNHQMHQLVVQQMMLHNRSSPAVHHHHYQMSAPSAPPVSYYNALPPVGDTRLISPMREGLRKLRRLAYGAWFIAALKANAKKNIGNRPSSVFLFGIILKEIVAALHRIYLNPSGNIYPVLADVINPNAYDLSNLLRGRTGEKETQVMLQELQYVVENLIYHITEIMPSTGVLGTHRKSAVYELIKNGKRFPDGYFWQCELDRLQFSENGRTVGIGDPDAFLLIVGIFISRSLITTLLMKPVDYGLSSQQLTDVAERNLKVIASTLLFLVRRVSVSRGRAMMPMPGEIARYLYTDEDMRPIYSKVAKSFNYAEGLLREWGQEYIKRLRAAPVPGGKS
ncbi:hypothetical protein FSP39_017496 [Pinctada imbricata]|uniref:DUF4587 domain-containing protein n=1 Tax=Pinctada imbricata TaxID=66713 RepID=A0AA89CCT8_PINIB|nr:hypothetical protein FSP39_017496 [Pinctada imbricata]